MTRHLAPVRQPSAGLGRTATGLAAGLLALVALAALIVGPPWALLHYVGSPIPHTLPDRHQLSTLLTQPLNDRRLVHLLAGLCWIAWAIFVLDTARSITTTPGKIQADDLPSWQPIRRLTALLVGTIALTLVGHRSTSTATALAAEPAHAAHQPTPAATAHATHPAEPGTVTVQEPHNGIHDSLWRIAQRTLGNGNRWPEIYRLNQGHPQSDGSTLTNPSLIQPGWILRLPHSPTTQARPDPMPHRPTPQHEQQPAPRPPSTHATPVPRPSPSPSTAPTQSTHPDHHEDGGIDLGDGIYLSAALATAVSAALLAKRRLSRRNYIPGSGHRDDLPVAPIVRTLNLAHLRTLDPDLHRREGRDQDEDPDEITLDQPPPRSPASSSAAAELSESDDPLPANAAPFHAGGLGLVGPGAADAARGMLLDALVQPEQRILTTRVTVVDLLEPPAKAGDRIRVCIDLDQALDELEEALRAAETASPKKSTAVLLIAEVPSDSRRLQAVLDNGIPFGIGAILLGQWRPGATTYVLDNGTVSATSAGAVRGLRGTRLLTAPAAQTAAVLDLLSDTSPTPSAASQRAADPEPPARALSPTQAAAAVPRPTPPMALRILGPTHLTWTPDRTAGPVDLTPAIGPRQRELLVLLALHPDGLTRDRLIDTIWPDTPRERPSSPLHSALARLRAAISQATNGQVTAIVAVHGERYRLDPALIDVDYWHLDDAISARSAADDTGRSAALTIIVERYAGDLAADLSVDWIETPRESIRRTALDAATTLARQHLNDDPQRALTMLEAARTVDPYNEALYQEIMRVQHLLHRDDAITRTLDLLTTRLTELDETPSPDTLTLARQLVRPEAS